MTHRNTSCVYRRGTPAMAGICHQVERAISPCGVFGVCERSVTPKRRVCRALAKLDTLHSFIPLIGTYTLQLHALTLSLLFLTHPSHLHPTPKNASTSHWSARLSGCSISFPLYPRTRKIGPICWFIWPEGLIRPLVKPSPRLLLKLSSAQKLTKSSR